MFNLQVFDGKFVRKNDYIGLWFHEHDTLVKIVKQTFVALHFDDCLDILKAPVRYCKMQ